MTAPGTVIRIESVEDAKQREVVQQWIDTEVVQPVSNLLQQPVLLPVPGDKLTTYQLAHEYVVASMGCIFALPAGLIVDGASTPWFSWSLGFLPDGLHRAGAAVHDWLYALQGQSHDWLLTRCECDEVFLDLMLRAGVNDRRARIMYRAVRLCGWWPWRNSKGPDIREPYYRIR